MSYGLRVMMMCQCRFILGEICTILENDMIMEETMHVGSGVYGKYLYFLLNFVVNIKL